MADTIAFRCPGCRSRLRAPLRAAGRAASCPGCGRRVTVPPTPPGDGPPILLLYDGRRPARAR